MGPEIKIMVLRIPLIRSLSERWESFVFPDMIGFREGFVGGGLDGWMDGFLCLGSLC